MEMRDYFQYDDMSWQANFNLRNGTYLHKIYKAFSSSVQVFMNNNRSSEE